MRNNKSTKITSIGYLDDINHLLSNSDITQLEEAAQDIHNLVVKLYSQNILKVNSEKTQMLQIEQNTSDASDPNRHMVSICDSKGNITVAQTNMKILGFTINARASMDTHLSRVKSKIGMELSKLKPYLTAINPEDRTL